MGYIYQIYCDIPGISACLKGIKKTAYGYHWEKIE